MAWACFLVPWNLSARFPEMPLCAALSFERLQRSCPQSVWILVTRRVENLNLDRWWWNPWWRCGTMGYPDFFFVKKKKSRVREPTDLLFFVCFWFKVLRCHVVFTIFDYLWVFKRWPCQGQWNLTPSHTMREPWWFSWKGKAIVRIQQLPACRAEAAMGSCERGSRWQISMRLWNKVQEAERDNEKHTKLWSQSKPGTQLTLVLSGVLGLVLGGLTFKNGRGHLGSR